MTSHVDRRTTRSEIVSGFDRPFSNRSPATKHPLPGLTAIDNELRNNKHVTLQLLWEEYRKENLADHYSYSRFCHHYEVWKGRRDVRMRQNHPAGEKIFVGQAVSYTLNQWEKLRRCFDYAEVELSNNLAENSMRGVALGRKNWLHVGSAKSGPKVAAIISVIESCRRLAVPVKEYLLDVLPGLNRRKLSEVAQLTPARWSAGRG